MKNLVSMKALGLAAIGLAALVPHKAAHAQTSGVEIAAAGQAYLLSSNESRATAAQALRRALEGNPDAPAAIKAEANFLLGDFALRDGKKDLALKLANQGLKLLEGREPNFVPEVRAFGARVKTQALLAKQNRLEAFTLILNARLAYGAPKIGPDGAWDRVWDNLYLWQQIALADLREGDRTKATLLMATRAPEMDQISQTNCQCSLQHEPVRVVNWENNRPNYPIVPHFASQTGGVILRLAVDSHGRVTKAEPTAFSPSEDFAIMTERVAKNWIVQGRGLNQPACTVGRPSFAIFQLF